MLVHPDQLRANLGLEGREGQYDRIDHYGCVQCQRHHWEGEPDYEGHKYFMSKHGTSSVFWSYYRKLHAAETETAAQRQKALEGERFDQPSHVEGESQP